MAAVNGMRGSQFKINGDRGVKKIRMRVDYAEADDPYLPRSKDGSVRRRRADSKGKDSSGEKPDRRRRTSESRSPSPQQQREVLKVQPWCDHDTLVTRLISYLDTRRPASLFMPLSFDYWKMFHLISVGGWLEFIPGALWGNDPLNIPEHLRLEGLLYDGRSVRLHSQGRGEKSDHVLFPAPFSGVGEEDLSCIITVAVRDYSAEKLDLFFPRVKLLHASLRKNNHAHWYLHSLNLGCQIPQFCLFILMGLSFEIHLAPGTFLKLITRFSSSWKSNFYRSINWWINWLMDWLIDGSIDWSIDGWIDWLIDRLIDASMDWLMHRWIDWLIDWLIFTDIWTEECKVACF